MARINIPAPISTYRDLGTVELAKLARNQYIEGYGAADEFSHSVSNMQSLSKDDHLKNKLSNQYTEMLEGWSGRGDYETLGIAINKGANQFIRDYSPIENSVKNRTEYQQRLQKAYDDGNINANTLREKLSQSDYMYQGIQYGEDGSLVDNSVYQGRQFYNDVDITEMVIDRMKNIKPFIRENLGTEVPYNEDMDITTTDEGRGPIKYWVTTKSKTVQIPDNIIQMVVNDVMSDPDVSASLAQEIELNTYQLDEIDPNTGNNRALDKINDLINKGHLKQEDLILEDGTNLLESMGPLVTLQNLMYQDAVNRETQLALGSYGGVRESGYGQTIELDDLWELNYKNKLEKTKKSTNTDDDLSYSTTVVLNPLTESYEDGLETLSTETELLKINLAKVSQHLNVHPDNIQKDEFGVEIIGKGEGLDLENMSNAQIVANADRLIDGWRAASAKATIQPLDYMGWKNSGKHSTQGEDEDRQTYLERLDGEYTSYYNNMITQQQAGLSYLNSTAAANDLDVDQFNSIMHMMAGTSTNYDVINKKLTDDIPDLSVPNTSGFGDISMSDFYEIRGEQLLKAKMGHNDSRLQITGQDLVDGWNYFVTEVIPNSDNPDAKNYTEYKTASNVYEIPKEFYEGNIFESFVGRNDRNIDIHNLIGSIAKIKQDQGWKVGGTYQRNTGEWTWAGVDDGYRYDEGNIQQSFNIGIELFIKQLQEDREMVNNKFASAYSGSSIPMEAMIMTNFGSKWETSSIVDEQLQDFFSDNSIPPNFVVRESQGQSPSMEFEEGFINSNQQNESNLFNYTVEYDIIEDQMGVLNMELGDDGAQVYVPIKIKNGIYKGKTYNLLISAKQFNIPALSEYINSAEMEVNTLWNKGVLNRNNKWSPSRYSNVTFDYDNNTVIISGEEHSKQKGLSILTQNLLNKRNVKH